jgi:hypothetical protein
MDVVPASGTAAEGRAGSGQRRGKLLRLGNRFDTFGLGRDVPIIMGNLNSSILALVDEKLINFVVPYPMGFFAKNVDGRVDDDNAGWKGKSLVDLWQSDQLPPRRRKGEPPAGREAATSAGPARAVRTHD